MIERELPPHEPCGCKYWRENMPLIDGLFMLAFVHTGAPEVEFFQFCPWCGRKLPDKQIATVSAAAAPAADWTHCEFGEYQS